MGELGADEIFRDNEEIGVGEIFRGSREIGAHKILFRDNGGIGAG